MNECSEFRECRKFKTMQGEMFYAGRKVARTERKFAGEISKSGIQLISRRDAVYFSYSETEMLSFIIS